MRLILGSGSPRRAELLAQLGVVADEVRVPDIDETQHKRELPRPFCIRMARQKLDAIHAGAGEIVLCVYDAHWAPVAQQGEENDG